MKLPISRGSLAACVSAALLFSLTVGVSAAYLANVPQRVVQPDGTAFSCFASGDEFAHWLHDAGGFRIIPDPSSGWFVYAVEKGGKQVPSELVPGFADPASAGLKAGLRPSEEEHRRGRASWEGGSAANPSLIEAAPTTGTLNNVVVFVRFADDAEFTDQVSQYEGMFNDTSSGQNSLKNYYAEVSYGQLAISSFYYPAPPDSTVVSFQDSHNRNYFRPWNSTSNPDGYKTETQRRTREHTLLKDAVNAIASQVPSDLVIDGDSDGRVDNVTFVVKGSPDGWSDLLWPHAWSLSSFTVTINGKRVWTYNLQLQLALDTAVLAHEMFHSLGAPDLYHYNGDGFTPVYLWDVMEYTSNPPQHMGAYMKYRYGGWITSLPEISAPGTYTLNPLTSPSGNAFRIPSPNSTLEYFVVEYRRREGTFESSLPGSGLLVYRINGALEGMGNADGPPDEVYVYRPNGGPTANGNPSQAHHSLETCRTALADSTELIRGTTPFLSDGSPGGLVLSHVGGAGETISFELGDPSTCNITCSASASPSSGAAPLSVAFHGSDQSCDCLEYGGYSWDFGDGTTSSQDFPTHTYTSGGTFPWTFKVRMDDVECVHTGTVTVTASCTLSCSASATPSSGPAPLDVAFSASATALGCSGQPSYSWDLGDGAASQEQNPSHTYSSEGSYPWTLTVAVDGQTCSKSGTVSVGSAPIPGDCDGNGTVSIGEVQRAINMFLGAEPVGCFVDCDGNGVVSIGEVQKVINAFLGVQTSC